MCSTHATGDATVATIVAYREGQLDETVYNDPRADNDMDAALTENPSPGEAP